MIELNVEGFSSFEVRSTDDGAKATGRTKVAGSVYFVSLTFSRREDGSLREKLFSRRIETFTGKAVRAKAGPALSDLADAASQAVLASLSN